METEDDIQNVLLLAGVDLEFASDTIRGISQQRLEELGDYGSPFGMVKNHYSFIVSAYDVEQAAIAVGQSFKLFIFNREFTFTVGSFTEDLTGWVLMYVTMVGNTNV